MPTGRMAGRRALVTGAGTGIGSGIAKEFAAEGAIVALHYSSSSAQALVGEIESNDGEARAFQADFRDLDDVRTLARDAVDYLGGLDVLVNNAGITFNVPFGDVTPEQYDTLFDVNVRAAYFLTQWTAPQLMESRAGAVINLTSVHGYAGMTEHSVYAGTKAAIIAQTRVIALELGQKGVRVNAIAPGWIFTENHRRTLGEAFNVEEAGKGNPSGFVGEPRDIGRLAVFLATEDSRYIVGQTLVCDGGQLAILPLTGDFREPRREQWGNRYVRRDG